MKTRFIALATFMATTFYTISAWAGSSSGGGPAGDSGSSGAEPEVIALILLSIIPGIYFARRARAAQKVRVEHR